MVSRSRLSELASRLGVRVIRELGAESHHVVVEYKFGTIVNAVFGRDLHVMLHVIAGPDGQPGIVDIESRGITPEVAFKPEGKQYMVREDP